MELPVHKKLPHTIQQWVPEGSSFFITIKCVPPGKNQLCLAGVGILAAMAHNRPFKSLCCFHEERRIFFRRFGHAP